MQERNSHSWLVPATVSLTLIPTVAAASGFALLVFSAALIYGERLGLNQILGLGALLIGIWLLARG